ncbi:hypothetical protein [Gracilimonas mengyeensis]|uniref:Uncharacterized protein n=1 Tax=Gracilimonas mengyeensis TaxID=1302730 RepID=A0A521BVM9_9BACT|nr:hypothetical protein [Gracilimonas mengyeensis]SMO50671.1 hypothetical protein SAMN06265219_10395 [Gracilimonas mengyeensis]
MRKVSEYKIEQYLRYPQTLSDEERTFISEEIKNSAEASKIYRFLKEYYEELDAIKSEKESVIPLEFKRQKQNPGVGSPVVLAAMSENSEKASLVTKATLVSERPKTVVRVLENKMDDTLQFHVHGEEPGTTERVIVSFQNPKLDLVTDEEGKLKQVRELSDIQWEEVSAVLRIPVFRFNMNKVNHGKLYSLRDVGGSEVKINQTKEEVTFVVKDQESSLSRILMVNKKSDEVILNRIDPEGTSFSFRGRMEAIFYFYK